MLVEKKIKETEREYAHTDLYFNGTYIGYYMKNESGSAAQINENWNFVSKHPNIKSTFDKTKDLLLFRINNLCQEVIK